MSKKPSLYVVERKEVVILVVIFLLVTALSFTVGVKYGENVGAKQAKARDAMAKKIAEPASNTGGTLGADTGMHGSAQAEVSAAGGDASDGAGDLEKTDKKDHDKRAESSASAAEELAKAEAKDAKESIAEGSQSSAADGGNAASVGDFADRKDPMAEAKAPMDAAKSSDADLLAAMQKAGLDGGASEENELPAKLKGGNSNNYVIQVGSFPTKADAMKHVEKLQALTLDPRVLPAVKAGNAIWHRVAVGAYPSRKEALQVARKYKDQGLIRSFFVRKVR